MGGHLDFNFTLHHQLRLILNVNGFASKQQDIYSGGFYDGTRQNSFSVVQLGADYVFNAGSPTRGGYFLVGLNLNQVKAKADFSFYPDQEVTQSGRVGLRVGGGVLVAPREVNDRRLELVAIHIAIIRTRAGSAGRSSRWRCTRCRAPPRWARR